MSPIRASLSVWPMREAQCKSYGKYNKKEDSNCFDLSPCSSTDSDSQDSVDQCDLEGSEQGIDTDSHTRYTTQSKLDCVEGPGLKGRGSDRAPAALAYTEEESMKAQERVSRNGLVSESKCSGSAVHQHVIMMYFEGRWLDLVPLDVVEEDDSDPLSSLDIQVFLFSSLFSFSFLFFSLTLSLSLSISYPLLLSAFLMPFLLRLISLLLLHLFYTLHSLHSSVILTLSSLWN